MCIRDRLEEALAKERTLELESELEQDEHPRDYDAELEDEEEEAAPTSEKRLKREIRAEALRRLEEAARTESDFLTVVDAVSYTHLDVYKRQPSSCAALNSAAVEPRSSPFLMQRYSFSVLYCHLPCSSSGRTVSRIWA